MKRNSRNSSKKNKSRTRSKSSSKSSTKGSKSSRKTSRKRRSSRKASNSKMTWEQFLKHDDSTNLLKKSWETSNPEKHYKETLIKLSKKYKRKYNKK